ncbi:rRNA maturation RNase YbeY [Methylocaldum sp. GT1TLB]|uniref:rRNA maturation RNase YbeY n=1 Tax=Methylocaldum sp. GT1TLB TaxID=3438965 RepID=UPI003D9FE601
MISVEVQHATVRQWVPEDGKFLHWASAAAKREDAELVIRIVDETESVELNEHYRHKAGPTNILSFPFEVPEGVPNQLLGDLVICAAVVEREAREQGKTLEAHWAHMVVHGVLHLQGYDHISESDAAVMEAEEIAILNDLGFPNPYEEIITS